MTNPSSAIHTHDASITSTARLKSAWKSVAFTAETEGTSPYNSPWKLA